MSRNTATMKLANEVRHGTHEKHIRAHTVDHKDVVQNERNMIRMADKIHLTRDQKLLARMLMAGDDEDDSMNEYLDDLEFQEDAERFLDETDRILNRASRSPIGSPDGRSLPWGMGVESNTCVIMCEDDPNAIGRFRFRNSGPHGFVMLACGPQ